MQPKRVRVTLEFIDSEDQVFKTEILNLKEFQMSSHSECYAESIPDSEKVPGEAFNFKIVRSPYAAVNLGGRVILSDIEAKVWTERVKTLTPLDGGF